MLLLNSTCHLSNDYQMPASRKDRLTRCLVSRIPVSELVSLFLMDVIQVIGFPEHDILPKSARITK